MNPRPVMVTQQTVRNLALGDKFFVRVAAVSSAGSGPPAVLDQPVHIQEITGKDPPRSRSQTACDGETEAMVDGTKAAISPISHSHAQATC